MQSQEEEEEDFEWFEVVFPRVFVKKSPESSSKGWGWVVRGQRIQVRQARVRDADGLEWVKLTLFELWRSCNVRQPCDEGFALVDGSEIGLGLLLRGPLSPNERPGPDWEESAAFLRWWPFRTLPPISPAAHGGAWLCHWKPAPGERGPLELRWLRSGDEFEVTGPPNSTVDEVCEWLARDMGLGKERYVALIQSARLQPSSSMSSTFGVMLCAMVQTRPRLCMARATNTSALAEENSWSLLEAKGQRWGFGGGVVAGSEGRRVLGLHDTQSAVPEPLLAQAEELDALLEGLDLPGQHVGQPMAFAMLPGDLSLQEALSEALGLTPEAKARAQLETPSLAAALLRGQQSEPRLVNRAFLNTLYRGDEAGRLRDVLELMRGFGGTSRFFVRGHRCPVLYVSQDLGSLNKPVLGFLSTWQDESEQDLAEDGPAHLAGQSTFDTSTIQLRIDKGLTGEQLCQPLRVGRRWTVKELKRAISHHAGIAEHEQRLLDLASGGATLGDDQMLEDILDLASAEGPRLSMLRLEPRWAEALRKVEANPSTLGLLPDDLRSDRDLTLAAVSREGAVLEFAAAAWRKDAQVVLAAAASDPAALELADDELWSNRDFALRAAELHGAAALRLARKALQADSEEGIEFFSEDEKDREVVLAAVRQDGCALEFASELIRGDREVVLAAVSCDGRALQFAADELRGDRDIALIAVKQEGKALRFASKEIRGDRTVVLAAVEQNSRALQFATEDVLRDREVVLAAMDRDPSMAQQLAAMARSSGVWT